MYFSPWQSKVNFSKMINIILVTTRGVLFNIYVQSGVVNYNTHRLPSKSSGLVRRVSSMFWTQQAEEAEPISSKVLGFLLSFKNYSL